MITAIGFAPHPPLLVPEVASGAAPELDTLRAACEQLVADLDAICDSLILIGSDQGLAIGRWLLARAGWTSPLLEFDVFAEPVRISAELSQAMNSDERIAALVMGDGSACRSLKAPGYFDERSIDFDDSIAKALSTADATTLENLDQNLATELLAAGGQVWPFAARVVATEPQRWRGELRYRDDPYGVSYFVALWTRVGIPSTTGP